MTGFSEACRPVGAAGLGAALRRARMLVALLASLAPVLPPASAVAAPADVLATGWGGIGDDDWRKGIGKGVYLLGGSSTVYRWSALRSADDEIVGFSPLWQTLRFSVRDDRNRHRVSFQTSVRGSADLLRGGFRGEVLYAFVELVPEGRWASARIGRQVIATGGVDGLTRMDGLSGRFVLRWVAIESHAGVQIRSRAFVVPKAEREGTETGWGGDWTWGVALATEGLARTRVRLGFQERRRDGKLGRRHLTLDGWQGLSHVGHVRANISFDLLQRRFQEVLAGVEVRPVEPIRAGVEYEHWQPSFFAGELFSVFATDPYDVVRAFGDARIGRRVDVSLEGGVQVHPEAITRDLVPWPEVGRLSFSERAGLRVRPADVLAVSVEERLVSGTGGTKFGLSGTARVTPRGGILDVGLRGDFQVYSFDLQPGLAGRYGGAALDVAVRPVPWMRVGARGETIFSPWLKNDFQVAATLDVLLGIKALGPRASQARLEEWQPAVLAAANPRRSPSLPGLSGGIGLGGEP